MNAAKQHTPNAIMWGLLNAFEMVDDGMSLAFELRQAATLADGLIETGRLFQSPDVQAAAQQIATASEGYKEYAATLKRLSEQDTSMGGLSDALLVREWEMDAAFVLGLAAGLRIAGGGAMEPSRIREQQSPEVRTSAHVVGKDGKKVSRRRGRAQ